MSLNVPLKSETTGGGTLPSPSHNKALLELTPSIADLRAFQSVGHIKTYSLTSPRNNSCVGQMNNNSASGGLSGGRSSKSPTRTRASSHFRKITRLPQQSSPSSPMSSLSSSDPRALNFMSHHRSLTSLSSSSPVDLELVSFFFFVILVFF